MKKALMLGVLGSLSICEGNGRDTDGSSNSREQYVPTYGMTQIDIDQWNVNQHKAYLKRLEAERAAKARKKAAEAERKTALARKQAADRKAAQKK